MCQKCPTRATASRTVQKEHEGLHVRQQLPYHAICLPQGPASPTSSSSFQPSSPPCLHHVESPAPTNLAMGHIDPAEVVRHSPLSTSYLQIKADNHESIEFCTCEDCFTTEENFRTLVSNTSKKINFCSLGNERELFDKASYRLKCD